MSPPCTLSERPLRRTFIRTNAAAGHTGIRPFANGFNVVGCTATRNSFTEGLLPGIDARDNTSTTGTGVPIYWLKGARVANNYADFYDGSWDDEANVKNESGSNGRQHTHLPVGLRQGLYDQLTRTSPQRELFPRCRPPGA